MIVTSDFFENNSLIRSLLMIIECKCFFFVFFWLVHGFVIEHRRNIDSAIEMAGRDIIGLVIYSVGLTVETLS